MRLTKMLQMSKLELKVHPPLILVSCGVFAWLVSITAPKLFDFPGNLATSIAIIIALVGLLLAACAVFKFRRAETTIDPTKPGDSSVLVTSGVFRFTRNPMYLALLLILIGWIVYLGNITGFLAALIFIVYISRFQIRPEERFLASRFGEAYSDYCNEVKRWV